MTTTQITLQKMKEEWTSPFRSCLIDLASMAKNEVQRVRTGKAPGPAMRDVIGQWESAIKEAERLLGITL